MKKPDLNILSLFICSLYFATTQLPASAFPHRELIAKYRYLLITDSAQNSLSIGSKKDMRLALHDASIMEVIGTLDKSQLADSFIAMSTSLFLVISHQLQDSIYTGTFNSNHADIYYLIQRLEDHIYFIDIPVSASQKILKNLKEGNFQYLGYKLSTLLFGRIQIILLSLFGLIIVFSILNYRAKWVILLPILLLMSGCIWNHKPINPSDMAHKEIQFMKVDV